MKRIHVGHAGLKGDFQRYARKFSFIELAGDGGRLPKRARLREWAAAAPPEFTFSLALPAIVSGLEPTPTRDQELRRALGDAAALGARWLVIRTPASVRPSSRNVRLLGELVEACRGERAIGWEPSGLWDAEGAAEVADQLSVSLIQDPLRQPQFVGATYFRVRALGVTSRMTAGAAEQVAEMVSDVVPEGSEGWLAVEGGGAGLVQAALSDGTYESGGDDDDLGDDELDDEELDDDESDPNSDAAEADDDD